MSIYEEFESPSQVRSVTMWGVGERRPNVRCRNPHEVRRASMKWGVWCKCHSMARWACCPQRSDLWEGSGPKQEKWSVDTGKGSACGIGTQWCGVWGGCHREEKMAVVLVYWLHSGKFIKCVTSQTGPFPVWTCSSDLFSFWCPIPGQPSVQTAFLLCLTQWF